MPDEICTACGGTMHYDDFTRTLICSVCGSSRAASSTSAPTPAPARSPEFVSDPSPFATLDLSPVSVPNLVFEQPVIEQSEAQPLAQVKEVPETTPEVTSAIEPEVKPAINPESKPAIKPEVKPAIESEDKPAIEPEVQPEVSPVKAAAQQAAPQQAARPASAFPKAFQGTSGPAKKPFARSAKPRPKRTYILSTKGKETLTAVRELMGNGQFKLALDRLNKMMPSDKSTSAFLLLSIVCGYQVNSTAEMLQKVADSPMAIQKLIFRPDWDIIASRKPGTGDFPFFIKEYFALCLMQNGTSVRELRMKTRGPQKGVRRSTLAMIDEEDSHNAERAAQLKAARNSSYRTLEERLESMDDRLDEYASSYLSEPSWYYERVLQERDEVRAMAAAAEARRTSVPRLSESAPTEETTPFPQVRPNMTPEEIVARKEELIRLISREEQKILE